MTATFLISFGMRQEYAYVGRMKFDVRDFDAQQFVGVEKKTVNPKMQIDRNHLTFKLGFFP